MAQNPFDQFDGPAQAPSLQRVGPANAKTGLDATRTQQQIQQGAATLPYEGPSAAASLAKTQQAVADRPFERGDKLRSDFTADPNTKRYGAVIPQLMAGLQTEPNAAGDNSLIYAYAKIMDPDSAVREAEGEAAANTAGFWDQKVEQFKKSFGYDGARGLPAGVANNLRKEMNRKVGALAKSYGVTRSDYQRRAQRQGVNADDVVGGFPGEPFFKKYDQLRQRGFKDEQAVRTAAAVEQRTSPQQAMEIDPTGGKPLLSPQDRDFLSKNARNLGPEGMRQYAAARNLQITDKSLKDLFDYYASGGTGNPSVEIPQTAGNILGAAAASPIGSYGIGAANALTGGGLDEIVGMFGGDAGAAQKAKELSAARNPLSSLAGNVTGAGLGMFVINRLGGALPGLAGQALTRGGGVGADALYGTIYGAGEDNANRGTGAVGGAVGGVLGNLGGQAIGRYIGAPIAGAVGRMRGGIAAPSAADAAISAGAKRTGLASILDYMNEAQSLGVPAALADASPELRSLAGSAVRRSPTASGIAEQNLMPRGRAQIDRLRGAVERDLGPVSNVDQISADLIEKARVNASPLYSEAYSAPVVSTPELSSLLQTPFGRQAISRAETIAANERRNPSAMGFALDEAGNPVLTPVPGEALAGLGAAETRLFDADNALKRAQAGQLTGGSRPGDMAAAQAEYDAAVEAISAARQNMSSQPSEGTLAQSPGFTTQTLDYAKRGMDDVLEQYRNPITRRMDLDEAGKAQDAVRKSFLRETDRLNPAYGRARSAYAGPASERDALQAGRMAYGQSPNSLGVQLQGQTPERLGQMQLGYRDALMGQAEKVRYSTNPFEATLGTPQAEQRLATMFPDTPGVSSLLRQRDMERGLASTTNDVLGNSKTAQRQIADEAFQSGDSARMAIEGAASLASGVPILPTLANKAGRALGSAYDATLGRSAVRKADEVAPILTNPDTTSVLAQLNDILSRSQAYSDYINGVRSNAKRIGGGIGGAAGVGFSQRQKPF